MSYELVDPTSGLPVLIKFSVESRVFRMYFTGLLVSAEISAVSSVVAANQGVVSGSSALTVGASSYGADYVDVRLSGGSAGEHYKVIIVVSDTGGNTLEGSGGSM